MQIIIIETIWTHKTKILIGLLASACLIVFSLEAVFLKFTANQRGLIEEQIPTSHRECIELVSEETVIEFELLAAYGKVIADFDETHIGNGTGFLEINEEDRERFINTEFTNEVPNREVCIDYAILGSLLREIEGDSEVKIENYSYPEKGEVLQWYEMFKGLLLIPYGNPIGLNRPELITVTSGYNVTRVIRGRRHVHKGLDFVPSVTWFSENPGKGSKDSINRAILAGEVSNFRDRYGALCSYVTNAQYRTLYCHCDSFIAEHGDVVKYGDPICFMGNTGFSTGVHTHFAVYERNGDGWNLIDPTPFVFAN